MGRDKLIRHGIVTSSRRILVARFWLEPSKVSISSPIDLYFNWIILKAAHSLEVRDVTFPCLEKHVKTLSFRLISSCGFHQSDYRSIGLYVKRHRHWRCYISVRWVAHEECKVTERKKKQRALLLAYLHTIKSPEIFFHFQPISLNSRQLTQ